MSSVSNTQAAPNHVAETQKATTMSAGKEKKSGGFKVRSLWPLAVLAAGFGLFFATGANELLTLDALRQHRETLLGWVDNQLTLAALSFVVIYAAMTAFSLPIATLATVLGGFLFGAVFGTTLVVIGATIGATILFIAAKTSIGDSLRNRAGPTLRRMEAGFRENAFSYLLVLRLIPVFPFFLVNLAPAFLGVSLRTFVIATFLGIIPGSFVYVQVGTGLGSVLDAGSELSLTGVLTPDVIIALVGLAVLSLLPVVYRRFFGKPRPGLAPKSQD